MVIPPKFQISSPAIASYDFFDIARQTGYIIFYGGKTLDSTGEKYLLDTNQVQPYGDGQSGTTNPIGYTEVKQSTNKTLQFESKFTKPFIADGDSILEAGFVAHSSYSNSETFTVTIEYKLFHVDVNSTATQLGSTITKSFSSPGVNQSIYQNFSVIVPISNQLFKKDEKIRAQIKITAASSLNANSYARIFHDPTGKMNTGSTTTSSTLKFYIPLKIIL